METPVTSSLPPLQVNATADLAAFASTLTFDRIPSAVIARAKLSLLDGIGVCLYGATLPWTRHVQDMVRVQGATPTATIFATRHKGSWSQAALANATAGHAFEMDDIHTESVVHPNSLTTPIAIGYAEAHPEVSGRDLLTAIVAGCEVGTRIGNAATTKLFLNGFHPQGTSGAFVAAATAGRLLNLDAQAMQNALGIGGSMAAGLMAAQEGAMVKRLHAGRAAEGGVYAAELAKRGFTGISDVVEAGYGGFLSSYSRTPNVARLTEDLGTVWETQRIGFKLYPNVTSIHTALDALRHIMTTHGLAADDIRTVEVGCGHMTFVHTAWTYRDAGVTAAQMNMFYGLAAMATGGDVTVADYTPARMQDTALLGFIPRIAIHEDAELEGMGHRFRHACRMKVTTTDRRTIDHEILYRRGSADSDVGEDEVRRKFAGNVRGLLSDADRHRIIELVDDLESARHVHEICDILANRVRINAD
jgi:2-methylcitrate dehydratase PrpD